MNFPAAMRALRLSIVLCAGLAACGTSDPEPVDRTCAEMPVANAGDLAALQAQRCNVPGSMGSKNWYRLSATLPSTDHVVQLELWPDRGAFKGGAVQAGRFTLTGADLEYATCGICLRALTDKGGAEREYFATAGTIEITAVSPDQGAPFVASIIEASFAEVDADRVEVADGCALDLELAKISGVVTPMGGAGGGAGGGGGAGAGGCKTTIGD